MVVFNFHVVGFEPVMEFCADRDDAVRIATDVSLELSAAWRRFVSVDVRDADGTHVCTVPEREFNSAQSLEERGSL